MIPALLIEQIKRIQADEGLDTPTGLLVLLDLLEHHLAVPDKDKSEAVLERLEQAAHFSDYYNCPEDKRELILSKMPEIANRFKHDSYAHELFLASCLTIRMGFVIAG